MNRRDPYGTSREDWSLDRAAAAGMPAPAAFDYANRFGSGGENCPVCGAPELPRLIESEREAGLAQLYAYLLDGASRRAYRGVLDARVAVLGYAVRLLTGPVPREIIEAAAATNTALLDAFAQPEPDPCDECGIDAEAVSYRERAAVWRKLLAYFVAQPCPAKAVLQMGKMASASLIGGMSCQEIGLIFGGETKAAVSAAILRMQQAFDQKRHTAHWQKPPEAVARFRKSAQNNRSRRRSMFGAQPKPEAAAV